MYSYDRLLTIKAVALVCTSVRLSRSSALGEHVGTVDGSTSTQACQSSSLLYLGWRVCCAHGGLQPGQPSVTGEATYPSCLAHRGETPRPHPSPSHSHMAAPSPHGRTRSQEDDTWVHLELDGRSRGRLLPVISKSPERDFILSLGFALQQANALALSGGGTVRRIASPQAPARGSELGGSLVRLS